VIVFTIIGIAFVVVGVLFLALNLAMTRRDHRRLRQEMGRTVPLEEYSPFPPPQLTPYVPPPWRSSDDDLNDPQEDPRDTPPA
jgi:hypothetical protein